MEKLVINSCVLPASIMVPEETPLTYYLSVVASMISLKKLLLIRLLMNNAKELKLKTVRCSKDVSTPLTSLLSTSTHYAKTLSDAKLW